MFIILLCVVLWHMVSASGQSAREEEPSYSDFVAQMDRGKVRKLLSSARVFRRPGVILLAMILVPCGLLGYAASKADTAQVLSGTNELAAVNTASGQLVLFGGGEGDTQVADTWTWTGTTWTEQNDKRWL